MEISKLSWSGHQRRLLRKPREWSYKTRCAIINRDLLKPYQLYAKSERNHAGFAYPAFRASTQIRVLRLLPSAQNDTLVATFCIEDITSPGSYEAVSHHWGPSPVNEIILCDGVPMKISLSISRALHRLRSQGTSRRLWIDSICIDQGDTSEKEQQVRLMGQIYANAQATLIWLEEEDETTAEAFSTIAEAASLYVEAQKIFGPSPTFAQLREVGFFLVKDGDWSALDALLCREWFYRTWVLQEVMLASRSVVHCGSHSCDWRHLIDVGMALLLGAAWNVLRGKSLPTLGRLAMITFAERGQHTLWQLMSLTREQEVSDVRDKAFALLGLASDAGDFLHVVDYTTDALTLYRTIFRQYLAAGRPGLLNQAGDVAWRAHSALPSWITDWSAPERVVNLTVRGLRHAPLQLNGPRPIISDDGKILTIHGFVFDMVTQVRSNISYKRKALQWRLEAWRRLATKVKIYPTGESSTSAFIRTILTDWQIPLGRFANGEACLDALRVWIRTGGIRRPIEEWSEADIELGQLFENISIHCDRRTFFQTQNGYMGLGSYFLRPGDLLVELDNEYTPFAIRPAANGCYTIVGEAYIQGQPRGDVLVSSHRVRPFRLV